jgi:hypothetical protein
MRLVLGSEYESSKREIEKVKAQIKADPKVRDQIYRKLNWQGDVLRRYEQSPYCRKKLNFLANEIEGKKL